MLDFYQYFFKALNLIQTAAKTIYMSYSLGEGLLAHAYMSQVYTSVPFWGYDGRTNALMCSISVVYIGCAVGQ